MKIAIVGATGFVGKALVNEALNRGHEVIALARNSGKLAFENEKLTTKDVDVLNTEETADIFQNAELIVSAFNAGWENPNLYNDFLAGSKAVEKAAKKAGKRLIVIGGAGSLYIAPTFQLVDTDGFPAEFKNGAKAARDYLNHLQSQTDFDWTFFSPAIEMHPGINTGRTGKYRLGKDEPVFDAANSSKLSVEDLAVAIIDEAEQAKHVRQRFTAAY
ncbi:histidine kinase [Pelobium manganitolerans]|uniref:Histidine kinase n=1 Tax=Pelobium manganitolerans TaxID=1842495 RepID=A0A419S2I4_9SPHI|nr:NAD(P)H-binding protein [Pelobium manganitolerans]RKD13198.1 histidine kinase [Pelobium manganitolerans]